MSKPEIAKIEHPMLDSKNATFVALANELIKWGNAQGLTNQQITNFLEGFKVSPKLDRPSMKGGK